MAKTKCYPIVETSNSQIFFRLLIGGFMIFAAIAHLSFARIEFQSRVPSWLPMDKDAIVIISGIFEFLLGAAMIYGRHFKVHTGILLSVFLIAIFPGNISQYMNGLDAFNLDTDSKRFARLFVQPVLIIGTLWSAGVFKYWMSKYKKN